MQEVRFRAWSKLGDEMLYQPDLRHLALAEFERESNLVWMQFTGLLDKNGEDIYSGDILRTDEGKIRTVFAVPGGFAVEALDCDVNKYGTIYCPIEPLSDEQTGGYFQNQSIVVGNIWQNMELLT